MVDLDILNFWKSVWAWMGQWWIMLGKMEISGYPQSRLPKKCPAWDPQDFFLLETRLGKCEVATFVKADESNKIPLHLKDQQVIGGISVAVI